MRPRNGTSAGRLLAGALLTSTLLPMGRAACAAPSGEPVFKERCVLCHQANAAGADGVAPSLVGTLKSYLATDKGRQYLSQILISGMVGKIETQGHQFTGLMPSFADDLGDATIAATLNFVLATFNGIDGAIETSPVSPSAVAAARALKPSATDTRKLRASLLEGGQ